MLCKKCKFVRQEYSNKYYVCTKKNKLLKKAYKNLTFCDEFKSKDGDINDGIC